MSTYKASEQTKKQLSDALREKMKIKQLNKISVRELTETCGLNRQTFYYHFKDIYDLLHWSYEQDAANLKRKHNTADTWQENLSIVLRYMEENREICLSVLNSMRYHFLVKFLYNEVKPVAEALVEDAAKDLIDGERFKQFLTHFYTITISSLVTDWIDGLRDEIHLPAEELVTMLDMTLDGTLQLAVQRYRKQYPQG